MRQLHPHVLWAMAGIAGILVLATAAVWLAGRLKPDRDLQEMRQRIRSWWIMAAFFLGALTLTRKVSLTFFAFVSFLAEGGLIGTRVAAPFIRFWPLVLIIAGALVIRGHRDNGGAEHRRYYRLRDRHRYAENWKRIVR